MDNHRDARVAFQRGRNKIVFVDGNFQTESAAQLVYIDKVKCKRIMCGTEHKETREPALIKQ